MLLPQSSHIDSTRARRNEGIRHDRLLAIESMHVSGAVCRPRGISFRQRLCAQGTAYDHRMGLPEQSPCNNRTEDIRLLSKYLTLQRDKVHRQSHPDHEYRRHHIWLH